MTYRHGIWHLDLTHKLRPGDNCQGWSPTIPRMVAPKTQGWSPTNLRMVTYNRKCTTDLEFDTYTLLTKLTPGDNYHRWSPTITPPTQGWSFTNLRMVTHQKEVYKRQGIWHLDLTHKTYIRWQPPWMVPQHPQDGHSPTQGWAPTRRKCTT